VAVSHGLGGIALIGGWFVSITIDPDHQCDRAAQAVRSRHSGRAAARWR
jgi:hypothetical protein